MIIDGHSHACGKFLNPDSIIKNLDKSGVDKVVLVPGELNSKIEYSLPYLAKFFPGKNVVKVTNYLTKFAIRLTGKVKDIPLGNEHVYNLKQKSHGRVIQFIWLTTHIENPTEYLENKFAEWNFKGVKLHQCWETFSIDSNFFREVALWSESHDIPLFIHIYSDKDVIKIIEYKKKHPNLKLIVAHLFGLELFINAEFKDSNLYFDISPVQLVSTKRLIDAISFYGADKILFGTDSPYGKDYSRKNIERVNNLDISESEKESILGKNINQLLNL
jgi:hypothetical protein